MGSNKYTTFIFLFFLFIPVIDSLLNLSKPMVIKESKENRALVEKPEVDINHLDNFPSKYELYYNDHFMLRDMLIDIYSKNKANYFNVSPVPDKAIIGKENWLFTMENELRTYDGTFRFSDSVLIQFKNEFLHRKGFLKQRNCSMYIYIIPSKLLVYPEYIGNKVRRSDKPTQGEQLTQYLKANTDISITYLLPCLLKMKNKNNPLLFLKTDTHWSDYGAYISYKEIINDLARSFPDLKPLNEAALASDDTITCGGNIAAMMQMEKYFKEHKHRLKLLKPHSFEIEKQNYPAPAGFPYPWDYEKQKNCDNKKLPKALIIHDSFTQIMMPFLSENFSHSTYLFDSWKYTSNENIIEIEKPDVVIYIIHEPLLKQVFEN